MKCPVCEIDTIVVERNEIEIDFCISCRGLWFDSGEIEILAEKLNCEIDLGDASRVVAEVSEKKRKCLRCGRVMVKVALTGARRVVVDMCDREHGLWFDAGEVGSLLQRRDESNEDSEPILTFLGEAIGSVRSEKG